MKSWFAILFMAAITGLGIPSTVRASAEPVQKEHQRIEALIGAVERASAVTFIRNGTSYDVKSAAKFLRLKWEFNASKVRSAEDFIREIATRSGTSGQPYRVKLADGTEQESAQYLHTVLSKLYGL